MVTLTDGPGAVLSASNFVGFVRLALLLYLPVGLIILSVRGDATELTEVEEVEADERKPPLESSWSLTAPVTTSMGVETMSTGVSSVMTDLFEGLLVALNF